MNRIALGLIVVMFLFASVANAAPKLVLQSNEIDLGTVEKGAVAKTAIEITNGGNAPLILDRVQSSCPCTTVELPPPNKRTIAPGAKLELPVTYDTEDKYGDVGSTIVLHTNDPDVPIALIDLGLRVESLVIYTPDTGVGWTLAPRGGDLNTPLTIMAGNEKEDIELIELTMAKPGITPHAETKVVNDRSRVEVNFKIDPDTPMGLLTNEVHARVRIGEEETTVTVPLRGGVIGDVLITPPAIISPRTAYQQGGRISEITVRSSHADRPAPKLIGVEVDGPLQATVEPIGADGEQKITVAAAMNAAGGPQGGTVYVMTESQDDPIVAVPVYFRMAPAVQAQPDHAVLSVGETQRIELNGNGNLMIQNLTFDQTILNAKIVPNTNAIEITAKKAQATKLTIVTNQPGATTVPIPILIK